MDEPGSDLWQSRMLDMHEAALAAGITQWDAELNSQKWRTFAHKYMDETLLPLLTEDEKWYAAEQGLASHLNTLNAVLEGRHPEKDWLDLSREQKIDALREATPDDMPHDYFCDILDEIMKASQP